MNVDKYLLSVIHIQDLGILNILRYDLTDIARIAFMFRELSFFTGRGGASVCGGGGGPEYTLSV